MYKTLAAVALWRAEIDLAVPVRESPPYSNLGKRVEEYQRTAGVEPPEPYCASAVFTWYKEGAAALGVPSPLPQSGYCPDFVNWARAHGRLIPAVHALPGDPVFYWHESMGRFAHAGLCRASPGDGTIVAIEANTNDDGGREGNGVYQKVRQVAGTRHVAVRMQDIGAQTTV